MSDGYRQEVFNVILAQLLQERGVVAAPENILRSGPEKKRRMPDVIVNFQGLRTVIEGEVDDQPSAQEKAIAAASKRVDEGIAHIGVAVVYPQHLRPVDFVQLKAELENAELSVAIVTEAGATEFARGNVDYLESALRLAFRQLVEEDVVNQAVEAIDAAIEQFALAIQDKPGVIGRIARHLDIREPEGPPTPKGQIHKLRFSAEQQTSISHIGGLVILNAMIFQEALSHREARVVSVVRTVEPQLVVPPLAEQWKYILEHINYFPIFHIARELILDLGSSREAALALKRLAATAQAIVHNKAALHRDLMGRVYHRLLADAKYLATYYTTIPAATLLLKLALGPDTNGIKWHDLEQIRSLRIADLACGTGTLLVAAADAITDHYISAAADRGEGIDFNALQKALTEQALYGYDVLPSAVHLTASTLALRAPETTFEGMNLYSMPHGGPITAWGASNSWKATPSK